MFMLRAELSFIIKSNRRLITVGKDKSFAISFKRQVNQPGFFLHRTVLSVPHNHRSIFYFADLLLFLPAIVIQHRIGTRVTPVICAW